MLSRRLVSVRQVSVIQSRTRTVFLRAGGGQSGSGEWTETVRTERATTTTAAEPPSGTILQREIPEERTHQTGQTTTHTENQFDFPILR